MGVRSTLGWLAAGVAAVSGCATLPPAPEPPPAVAPAADTSAPAKDPALPSVPPAADAGQPLPIDLPTALRLGGANPLDIAVATERVRAADAQLDRANVLWVPTLNLGADYFRQDGRIQDVVGFVFNTSKSAILFGAGPQAVVPTADAWFAPLAARQVARARQAEAVAARNDSTLAVAEAYFNVQQARGEVAGAAEAARRATDLVRRTEQLAPGLVPTVEVNRARAEQARRTQAVEAAYERWQTASAELTRLLRLEPGTVVEPAEPPHLRVPLIDPAATVGDLIPVALTRRPELAANQAIIQAALARVKQEKARPFLPVLAVRGVGSNTPGLAGGAFGGGVNGDVSNFGARFSVNVQAVWEFQNLGLGNRALVREREAENRVALLELLRTQDRIAAEVTAALAQVRRATARAAAAEDGLRDAVESADKNLQGLGQTKRAGEQLLLVIRPQEAVAAVTALDQAYRDYYAAVGDANRAHFRLYRALGHPADCLPQAATMSDER